MKRTATLVFVSVLLAFATGCRTPQGSLSWSGPVDNPPAERTAPPRVRRTLAVLDHRTLTAHGRLPAPLTGINKPDGLAMRYRRSVPPDTPDYVARTFSGLDLVIADPSPEGWLALYRGTCGMLGDVCTYRAVLYADDGLQRWNIPLNRFIEAEHDVEIQDIRLAGERLYFNVACTTFSSAVAGPCAYLVKINPLWQSVEWQTPPLTSNNVFILHDGYVVTGYGYTAEPDAIFLIDERSGRIVARADLDAAHQYLEIQGDRLYVLTYESLYTFSI